MLSKNQLEKEVLKQCVFQRMDILKINFIYPKINNKAPNNNIKIP